MGDLVIKKVILAGLDPNDPIYEPATEAGDLFPNSGFTFLHFKNLTTQETTVIIDSVAPCSQGHDHNEGGVVPVSKERMFGPFDRGRFNDANGKVKIDYTGGVTDLTVAAIEVKP